MPRPALPPTPSSSSDIKGRDGSRLLGSLQLAFELPPPAMASNEATTPQQESKMTSADSQFVQASETVKSRRRSSAARETKDAFTLPPPPTRSRKIIQMKPKSQEDAEPANSKSSGAGKSSAAGSIASAGTKKKKPSATSAAGRKIARKTAHSLIERRRRSKMNEEFAVLKNMVPACKGEMHKLAILQASIDYVRYLEDCVSKLKAQRGDGVLEDQSGQQTPSGQDPRMSDRHDSDSVEMVNSAIPSPTHPGLSQSHQSSMSPVLHAEDTRHRQDSYSSVSTDQRHYSYSSSATTSPAFGPQPYGHNRGTGSTLPSPALLPQRDPDQEATAALLMLNADRRGMNGITGGLEGGAPPAPGRACLSGTSSALRGRVVKMLEPKATSPLRGTRSALHVSHLGTSGT